MKRFYESEIEVMLGPIFDRHIRAAMSEMNQLERLRDSYLEGSQQYVILTNLIKHSWNAARTATCGFLGSYNNCAFSAMYLVFGIDVIGFLFDQPWVPFIEVPRFNLPLFVHRVSILERAFEALVDGAEIPIRLEEAESNLWAATFYGSMEYSDKLHGFFLRQGFNALKQFGEAAKDLDHYRQAEPQAEAEYEDGNCAEVFIQLVKCYDNGDADRRAYAEYQRRYGPKHETNAIS